MGLLDLLETVTEQYKYFSKKSHRLLFFENIQCHLLDLYLEEAESVIDELDTRIYILRNINFTRDKTSFNEKLMILSRVMTSLDYVVSVLKEWGESIVRIRTKFSFFLNFKLLTRC